MRAPSLESHDEFEGVGAHELNQRFDWIPEEHGDDTDATEFDPPNAGVVVDPADTPKLAAVQHVLLTAAPPGQLHGGDTSHYQVTQGGGKMDIARNTYMWWCHKASQSTAYRDPTLDLAVRSMSTAGIEIPGSYHWGSSTTDPEKQAANWLAAVGPTYTSRLFFMGDMEEGGLSVDRVVTIYEAVEKVTKRPCSHYTGLYVTGGALYKDERIRSSKYGPRPVVVAAYVTRARLDSLVASQGGGKKWQGWQWSSNGPVSNVVGRCDMDEVADKQSFLVSLYGATNAPDPIEPTPIPGADMSVIINCDERNPFLLNGGYATGLDGGAFSNPGLPIQNVDANTWDSIVATSNQKKAADAAMANGITVNVQGPAGGSGPTHASGTIDLNNQTIDLTLS